MQAGETFYQPNLGLPVLRDALATYMNGLYGTRFSAENVAVTISGMTAISLASQLAIGNGDTVVTVSPAWPNLPGVQQILGANVVNVPLSIQDNCWTLDLDQLFEACDANTTAILINSPANPTGWMLTDTEQQRILEFCRERGLWLLADEVYNRIVYGRKTAPTFADKMTEDDKVIIINSFSKAWAMTGWRMGWLTAPKRLLPTLELLTEFTNSCVFAPIQLAGVVALEQGEPFIAESMVRYQAARDYLLAEFAQLPRIVCPKPEAAFYLLFSVEGMTDSLSFAQEILAETGVGLAPGAAFGAEGEGFLRLCYAKDVRLLEQAMEKMRPKLM
ncbi:MAG: aspartate/methionine/tyrosine aminotransferase [Cellvibrionaceae bacterium]